MDPFLEVPPNELAKLHDILETSLPYGVEGQCILATQLSRPILTDIYNFKFYCPGGDISHGMVAVSDKEENCEVFICPTNITGLTALENALINTKLIDWNREVTVHSVNSKILDCLKRLSDKLGLKLSYENEIIKYNSRICKYLLCKECKPFENLIPPVNTYVGAIKPEHLDLVNRNWAFYNGQYSFKNLETIMRHGQNFVLYSSDDHAPLSWIAVDKGGVFTALYCMDAHRRKGYAEFISKVAINDLLKEKKHILAYILEENFQSQNLLKKLGFDFVEYVWWVFLKKVSD